MTWGVLPYLYSFTDTLLGVIKKKVRAQTLLIGCQAGAGGAGGFTL